MAVVAMKQLLEAGVHFGHQTRRWDPKMAEYIFQARNGIHIIDLQKTSKKLDEAYAFLEYTFGEYTMGLEDMTPAQVNRYRDLCRAEWRKRKAEEEGNNKDAKDIQAEIKYSNSSSSF